ncbi:MAG: DegT/DnrJ/EryC1/StrS family aminotransferase [Candidatus Omnitrophica bacterium]|nr:DegT/DnrJ/EryC1/StrS family aminotransferase [Candidatus Omnitrophota bacterium]MCM8800228.1 DegT/DnrJ/EryC1/StrS family aminotransferase [Candidatus Omnitrophota bacterium]
MIKIPLIKPDLPKLNRIEKDFRRILDSGKISNFGRYLSIFEKELSSYLDTEVSLVSSGTTGLILALQAIGVSLGKKVILPSFTFMATAQAILYAGGEPVFCDIDEDMTLSLRDLEFLLEKHSDIFAVLGVHTFGLPCKVKEINKIVEDFSKRYNRPIHIIYDSAHALGAEFEGKKIGCFGDAEVFSLSVTKPLVSVEGGVVSSKNSKLIKKINNMRNYGIGKNYNTYYPGLNSKMSEFHAIIGLYNLRRFGSLLRQRQTKARYYLDKIKRLTSFEPQKVYSDKIIHTYKDFTILIPKKLKNKRTKIMYFLQNKGIETRTYFYPPLHQQRFFRKFSNRKLPLTEDISQRVITIPFYASINQKEMDYVVKKLKEAERRFL